MLGAQMPGHGLGVLRLVVAGLVEADGEGLARTAPTATASSATTVDESTPPDKNAPSGTSATICPANGIGVNRLSNARHGFSIIVQIDEVATARLLQRITRATSKSLAMLQGHLRRHPLAGA
jgi:hypothetical protein